MLGRGGELAKLPGEGRRTETSISLDTHSPVVTERTHSYQGRRHEERGEERGDKRGLLTLQQVVASSTSLSEPDRVI